MSEGESGSESESESACESESESESEVALEDHPLLRRIIRRVLQLRGKAAWLICQIDIRGGSDEPPAASAGSLKETRIQVASG